MCSCCSRVGLSSLLSAGRALRQLHEHDTAIHPRCSVLRAPSCDSSGGEKKNEINSLKWIVLRASWGCLNVLKKQVFLLQVFFLLHVYFFTRRWKFSLSSLVHWISNGFSLWFFLIQENVYLHRLFDSDRPSAMFVWHRTRRCKHSRLVSMLHHPKRWNTMRKMCRIWILNL